MKLSVLASGSKANVTYIETSQHKILIDAGLSAKKTKEALAKIDRDIAEIDAIFITHEHSDHAKGLGVLMRKYHIKAYTNQKTWQSLLPKIGKVDTELCQIFETGELKLFDELQVLSFATSHDAAQPQCYKVKEAEQSAVIVTDTGYVPQKIWPTLSDSTVYVMECNHDIELLRSGPYSWDLKTRILSDQGHLSNSDSAKLLANWVGENTEYIYLSHLSKDNNTREVAFETIDESLQKNHIYHVKLMKTQQNHVQKLITL